VGRQFFGHRLYVGEALAQLGLLRCELSQVLQQVARGADHFGDLGSGIADQPLRSAPSGNGGSVSTPENAFDAGIADQSAHQCEHAAFAHQCASRLGTSMMMRAVPSRPSSIRRTRPIGNPAKYVQADLHPLGIVGDQHQGLGGLERAARVEHVHHRAGNQQHHQQQ